MLAEKIRSLRFAQEEFRPLDTDQAGALGEEMAYQKLVKVLPTLNTPTRIYRSLRVPKKSGQGKFEIDLLLVTGHAVLAIEVKHWGGRLSVEKGQWLQERRSERKSLLNPLPLHQEKIASLRAWLQGRGISVPETRVYSLLLFSNEKASFDGSMKKMHGLVRIHRLAQKVQKICAQPAMSFWEKKPQAAIDYKALTRALDQLPTWDRLLLHGGRILQGDVVSLSFPGVADSKVERREIQSFRVRLVRRIWPGFFLRGRIVVKTWKNRRRVFLLHHDASVEFRAAGQKGTEVFSLLHVERLDIGFKDHSYYD